MGIRTARSRSAFTTYGIWDDTVPWGGLVGKYLVDGDGQIRKVRSVNHTRGTVTFKDGAEVPGWVIDQDFRSLHGTMVEAIDAVDDWRRTRGTVR